MDTNRRAAVIAGVLFITATVADVISRVGFLTPILGAPDALEGVAANESRVLLGALLLVVGAVAASGIAIALYPVLRQRDHALAIGSVGFRLIEGAFYLGIVVCLLILVALGREAAQSGIAASPAYEASARLVMAARDALGQVGVLAFSLGALMYYSVFYRSRLVPRWLSAWGLLAITSVMASGVLVIAGVFQPMSPPQMVLALPIGVQEMVLAIWLIAKGFSPVRETTREAGLAAAVTPHPTGAPAAAR
jgi:hypothetical protein